MLYKVYKYHCSVLLSLPTKSSTMPGAIPNHQAGLQYFMSQPWCAKILTASSTLVIHASENRVILPFDENRFVAQTINTTDTIAAWIVFYERPEAPEFKISCYQALVALKKGVIGFPGCCHGGVIALLFDEVTGMHLVSQRRPGTVGDKSFRTAYLNISYVKPVPAPSTVLIKSWISRVEGRKHFVNGVIEDEHGNALARGEALYISIKGKL